VRSLTGSAEEKRLTSDRLSVVVALATYRRPSLLEGQLPDLVDQARDLEHVTRVVVVDNDPAESARPVVSAFADQGVEYFAEPRPGIAAARNRALDEAADNDVLVFLDDDERPAPGWLTTLVTAWQTWRCAAVAGPVVSSFEGPVDRWVEACSTFRRRRLATGTVVHGAATNNLLLDLAQLRALELRFDDRFGLTGGSDTLLTHTLVKRGGQIRWCDEALMLETVPAERATRRWALRRTFRTGNGWVRVKLALSESRGERLRTRLTQAARALAALLLAVARGLSAVIRRDLEQRVDAELGIATALGCLAGARGHVTTEYLRPP
jgi:succinoglycan biosynthesis protein ExoM